MAQSIERQMAALLDEYEKLADDVVEKSSKKAARDAAQKLRNVSPKRPGGGEYASSWSFRKYGKGYVTYNKKHYQLTHLLENGHVIRNKYGEYGRAPAHVHIAPVEAEYIQEYIANVRRELSK